LEQVSNSYFIYRNFANTKRNKFQAIKILFLKVTNYCIIRVRIFLGEMHMKKVELLAPAGSMESLYAAVQSGADAVYLGGNKFSARAYASNFDEENMTYAVNYCHLYGVKVYITINTLIKESEIKEALQYVSFLYSIGVDALIIQDTGLAYLIRRNFPKFEIHASTQMTVHNGEGALLLKNSGFSRIVLSRELSLQEVKHISKDLGVETEIFVHGALCICYSGQCLMSSMIGGRSGNRGRCAQPCRLPYTLIDRENEKESSAYILSPKDICTLDDIEKIIENSTSSLKIEGRMKRPEYVAGVVDVYRRAIDSVYEGKEFNFEEENNKLLKLFNREGFSKAYFHGNKGRDMMAYNFPKNTGVLLGKVIKNSFVELKEALTLGDGVRNGEEGFTVSKIILDGKEVEEASSGDKVKLLPLKYSTGDVLYKTSDTRLLSELEAFYKNNYERKIELPLSISFKVNEPLKLNTIYNDKGFSVTGEVIQTALKKPLELEKVEENLRKSGDTSFRFNSIEVESFEEGFLPVSAINSARRQLVKQIEEHVIDGSMRELKEELDYSMALSNDEKFADTIVVVNSINQLKAVKDSMTNPYAALDIFKRQSTLNIESVIELDYKKLYLRVPNIIKTEFDHVCSIIEKMLPHIQGIITANLGIISRFNKRTNIIGDYKLNIFNSYAFGFYKDYVNAAAISVELNKKELVETIKNKNLPVQVKIYGKEELMVSEYCPIGSVFGEKSSSSSCSEDCAKGDYVLKDRKGEQFILRTDKFCRSYIYNGVGTNLIPHVDELKNLGVSSFRLDFVDEDYEETLRVINSFKEGSWQGEYINFTRGHYKRGVE
jgi:putative protease